MAENKTKPTDRSVTAFLNTIHDNRLRDDCHAILEMMRKASNSEPVMWGNAIVGFGSYHYVHESGREGDTIIMGFSPRKKNISIYLTGGLGKIAHELARLGTFKTGKGCFSIKSLRDVNIDVFGKVLAKTYQEARAKSTHEAASKKRAEQ